MLTVEQGKHQGIHIDGSRANIRVNVLMVAGKTSGKHEDAHAVDCRETSGKFIILM